MLAIVQHVCVCAPCMCVCTHAISISYSMAMRVTCCDVKPEGLRLRPSGFTSQQCQYLACSLRCHAITNLLHASDWILLSDACDVRQID